MTRIAILCSTGSIGTQTLEVIDQFPDQLEVVALAAGRNVDLLIQQVKQYRPRLVSVASAEEIPRLRAAIGDDGVRICSGAEGLLEVASEDADLLIGALVGGMAMNNVGRLSPRAIEAQMRGEKLDLPPGADGSSPYDDYFYDPSDDRDDDREWGAAPPRR